MTDHTINKKLYKWEILQSDDGMLIRNLLTDYNNLDQIKYYLIMDSKPTFGISELKKYLIYTASWPFYNWESLRSGQKISNLEILT